MVLTSPCDAWMASCGERVFVCRGQFVHMQLRREFPTAIMHAMYAVGVMLLAPTDLLGCARVQRAIACRYRARTAALASTTARASGAFARRASVARSAMRTSTS